MAISLAAAALSAAVPCAADPSVRQARQTGIEQLLHPERLPLLRTDARIHYEGSIDKRGGNADWDWWLREEPEKHEWVLCEAEGPGCLWNFVAHHAVGHSDPVYRFYIDGAAEPAFEIKHSEFGSKAPFLAPLADKFFPTADRDERLRAINFQIVRSFFPVTFTKSLRITSSIKLEGTEGTGGGWGHAIWQSYLDAEGMNPFTGKEEIVPLLELWRRTGKDPKPTDGNEAVEFAETLPAHAARIVFERAAEGSLGAILLRPDDTDRAALANLWIRITWDGEAVPAVECPVSAFFGNEFGAHHVQTLMQGTKPDGSMYSYWPMPFWRSATVALENRGETATQVRGAVVFKPASARRYPADRAGHFRASRYQPLTTKPAGRDSPVATIRGRGHLVAGLITAERSMCEGDVRVYIDGCGTPAVESDGSESWACYGWGFEFPPQVNPASSYDGRGNAEWSMARLLMGDCYPFRTELRLTVESGLGTHEGADSRSGVAFWYGEPDPAMALTDFVDVGDTASETAHDYVAPGSTAWDLTSALEGEFDDVAITDNGRTLAESSRFTVKLAAANQGVLLRRRSDQAQRGQRAVVYVDGVRVAERDWLAADGNPNFRWLEDEFMIPEAYTRGKAEVAIVIEPAVGEAGGYWTESLYWVFSMGLELAGPAPVGLPAKAIPAFDTAAGR